MAEKKKKSPLKGKAVVPEVVENATVQEEFLDGVAEEGTILTSPKNLHNLQFTVKVDTKKFDGRTLEQAQALLYGSAGSFKKMTIEQE